MRKKVLLSLLILIIAASVLTACNKGKDKNPAVTYGDIYVQHGGIVRKTDYDHDRSFVLPEGLMPYYEEKGTVNTYKEYVNAYDKENGVFKVRKDILGENGKVASSRYGFVSLKTKNLIGSGVVYQSGAFDCVADGQINLTPNQSAYNAARDALNGWDPTYNCLFYYNPRTATSKWMLSRPVKLTIGNHAFC